MKTWLLAVSAVAVLLVAQSDARGRWTRPDARIERPAAPLPSPARPQLTTLRGGFTFAGYDDWSAYAPVMPAYGMAACAWPNECCPRPCCPPRRERCVHCGHRKGGLLCRICCGPKCGHDCCAEGCDHSPCEDPCLEEPRAPRHHRRHWKRAHHGPTCDCPNCLGPAGQMPGPDYGPIPVDAYRPQFQGEQLIEPGLPEGDASDEGPELGPSAERRPSPRAAGSRREVAI